MAEFPQYSAPSDTADHYSKLRLPHRQRMLDVFTQLVRDRGAENERVLMKLAQDSIQHPSVATDQPLNDPAIEPQAISYILGVFALESLAARAMKSALSIVNAHEESRQEKSRAIVAASLVLRAQPALNENSEVVKMAMEIFESAFASADPLLKIPAFYLYVDLGRRNMDIRREGPIRLISDAMWAEHEIAIYARDALEHFLNLPHAPRKENMYDPGMEPVQV